MIIWQGNLSIIPQDGKNPLKEIAKKRLRQTQIDLLIKLYHDVNFGQKNMVFGGSDLTITAYRSEITSGLEKKTDIVVLQQELNQRAVFFIATVLKLSPVEITRYDGYPILHYFRPCDYE